MHLQSIQTICTHSTWQWKRPTDRPTNYIRVYIQIIFRVSDIMKFSSFCHAAIGTMEQMWDDCFYVLGCMWWIWFHADSFFILSLPLSCSKQSFFLYMQKHSLFTYTESWFIQWPNRADLLCHLMFSTYIAFIAAKATAAVVATTICKLCKTFINM